MRRTEPTPQPQDFAAQFVVAAEALVAKVLARRHPHVDVHTATLRLQQIVGSSWLLTDETGLRCALLDQGTDDALSGIARYLARASIAQLDLRDRGRLMSRMAHADSGEPSHFRVAWLCQGWATWSLKVTAHCHATSVTVAALEGTLEQAKAAA